MGQEKSVPIRCNTTCHKFSSSIKKSDSLSASTLNLKSEPISKFHATATSLSTRSPSRNTSKSTRSSQSTETAHHSSHHRHSATRKTSSPSSSFPYKNIAEDSRTATASRFQPARNGIRNYTPKILIEQRTPDSASASSTSSNESEDLDIWN